MDEVGIASSFGSSGPWCGRAWACSEALCPQPREPRPTGSVRPRRQRRGRSPFWKIGPGSNQKIDEARQKPVAEIVDRADQRAANVVPIIRQIQRSGATSLRQVAEALNARGISAPCGGQWHATSVRNVMVA
jgi:hypothetical protein